MSYVINGIPNTETGLWIMHDDEFGLTCECPFCHIETMGATPFCPYCGSAMCVTSPFDNSVLISKKLEVQKEDIK